MAIKPQTQCSDLRVLILKTVFVRTISVIKIAFLIFVLSDLLSSTIKASLPI